MNLSDIKRWTKEDIENDVECGFNLRTLLKYHKARGILTKVGPGISHIREIEGSPKQIRYALCPFCRQGYYALKDANSCLTGHTGKHSVDKIENEIDKVKRIDKIKAETVFQYGFTILMKKKYAVISVSRTLAENFATYAFPAECLLISTEKDLAKITTEENSLSADYSLIFLGRPSNYMKHFSLEYPFVREELEKIEMMRDAKYIVKQGDNLFPVDEWDLADFKGTVFTRTLIDGRPAYKK